MKKIITIILFLALFLIIEANFSSYFKANATDKKTVQKNETVDSKDVSKIIKTSKKDIYPNFYRGIYLNVSTAKNYKKLKKLIAKSKKSHINTFVMDVQSSRHKKSIVPSKNVALCIENGIHPIARVVVFPQGLKNYPVKKWVITEKLKIAESAALNGFKEIQFDYIRFNDSNRLRHLSLKQRYAFIEGFLKKAKEYLKKYNVKIAADVFGRIPLNRGDLIGQRMEGLDKVVDVICPMAYPSHYTWSKKLQHNPYHTVYITSKRANERTKNAHIVSYIQAFKIKIGKMKFSKYIEDQIRACHDAGIKGFIFWNARQKYKIPFMVTKKYYEKNNKL